MIEKWTEENRDSWCIEIQETLKTTVYQKDELGFS